ncbi:MAG: hypothetical protein AVDCRST_MAG93-4852 [uncultured Chloroflexia bacterium]|uniref:Uncharacterized protein n=1 Tax=uncultured Chloroflexia bacterium TaxID=1672391 RepID=A0A6J4KH45_9CHLR|nr:MAG: hypothetical protein AVDCRST_MAG93-4852 [uncultured Chloroflexia bacterium]
MSCRSRCRRSHSGGCLDQLDEATWQTAWAEGRAMPLEQAIAYALEMGDPAR